MPGSKVPRPRLDQPFVIDAVSTINGPIPLVAATLTRADRIGGYKVRWGIGRYTYTVDPGLYAIGTPDDRSPVLVSANYKLSFDALRREMAGRSAWILVLDTRGINVWCAAGKGTFGTDELVARIQSADLNLVVSHNVLVVPQLGAPGVDAPAVRARARFRVVYGPVRASDLPAFLDAGMKATPAMRRVQFTAKDRLVLVPVEMVNVLKIAAACALGAAVVGGIGPGVYSVSLAVARAPLAVAAALSAIMAGTVLTPLLLPWVPGRMFSLKGGLVGALVGAVLLTKASIFGLAYSPASLAATLVFIAAGSSFAAMNYTGTSTYTSLHGVEKEMAAAMPWQAAGAVLASVLWIAGGWF
ncbi:MAG TPA: mercury methylation corrinoid protein HgcA [Coriobacteriia bacterium]